MNQKTSGRNWMSRLALISGLALAGAGLINLGCGNENPIKNKESSSTEIRGKWYNEPEITEGVVGIYRDGIYRAVKDVQVIGNDVVLKGDFQRVVARDRFGRETRVPFDTAVVQVGDSDTPNIDAPRLRFRDGMVGLVIVTTGFYNYLTWSDKYWIEMGYSENEDLYRQFLVSE